MAEKGRPSDYTPELAHRICKLISEGATLRQISTMDDMPCYQAVLEWARDNRGGFGVLYARARADQADWYADRITEISEKAIENPKDSNAYRVAGDLMKWACAVRRPHVYGERQQLEHSGGVAVSFAIAGLDGNPAAPVPVTPVTD